MRVVRNSLATDKPVARGFPIELEFRSVGFCGEGGGNLENPEKNPQNRGKIKPTTNSTHMMPGPGIESGPHWWEASSLTTALPLFCSTAEKSHSKDKGNSAGDIDETVEEYQPAQTQGKLHAWFTATWPMSNLSGDHTAPNSPITWAYCDGSCDPPYTVDVRDKDYATTVAAHE